MRRRIAAIPGKSGTKLRVRNRSREIALREVYSLKRVVANFPRTRPNIAFRDVIAHTQGIGNES